MRLPDGVRNALLAPLGLLVVIVVYGIPALIVIGLLLAAIRIALWGFAG